MCGDGDVASLVLLVYGWGWSGRGNCYHIEYVYSVFHSLIHSSSALTCGPVGIQL